MRPVNLIPPEQRRGDQAPLRTGPFVYIVIGVLVAALGGVIMLVLTGNEIAEREDQVVKLEREDTVAAARAERLVSYVQFQAASERRVATVQSLADSRFDWERVLRELALVLPRDVALSSLTASGAASAGGEGGEGAAAGILGPSMEMSGCAAGHDGVAGFITALKDIDGVTRVGIQSSQDVGDSGDSGSGGGEGGECALGGATTQFSLTVAFDAAPVPPAEGEAAPEATPTASEEGAEGAGEEADGGE